MDIMGELINCYVISDVVVLGGAFANIGGHNAAEAAQFECKIITGENYFNQVELFSLIDGITISKESNLADNLLNYMALPKSKVNAKCKLEELVEDLKGVL